MVSMRQGRELGEDSVHGLASTKGAAEQVAEFGLVVETLAAGDEGAGSHAFSH